MDLYIAPVKFSNHTLLERISKGLSGVLKAPVKQIRLEMDFEAAYSRERRQYYSTQLITQAIPQTPSYDGKILMVTEHDLYVPVLTFIYGEAQLRGKHSIVSVCRLHEEFYSGHSDDELLYQRTMKEILHELGHNFGLIHCRDWDCVMHSSLEIEEIDIKGSMYCKSCSQKAGLYRESVNLQ